MLKKLEKAIAIRASKICISKIPHNSTDVEIAEYALLNYSRLKNLAITEIAQDLSLARGTVTRWIELKSIPRQYEFDILKMAKEEINYSKYSDVEKDQFFTPMETVELCFKIFTDKLKEFGENIDDYCFIEPAAGAGAFLNVLPEDTIAMDIEPRSEKVDQMDYLTWHPEDDKKYIVFGNPPFGLRGNLALRFMKHSSKFSDYVCFILPQLFESDGKGSPRKRVDNMNLVYSKSIDPKFHMPDGRETTVNVVFQIWSKHHISEEYRIKQHSNTHVKVYSLSDGGSSSTTRNKDKQGKCDFYLPSTCYGKENMKVYDSFDSLPNRKGYGIIITSQKQQTISKARNIDWSSVAFLSTNSAYNLRTSKILEVLS